MEYLAAVVGAFLFYQYVSRRHKIILVSVVGGGAVLLLAAGLTYDRYHRMKNQKDDNAVSVRFEWVYLDGGSIGKPKSKFDPDEYLLKKYAKPAFDPSKPFDSPPSEAELEEARRTEGRVKPIIPDEVFGKLARGEKLTKDDRANRISFMICNNDAKRMLKKVTFSVSGHHAGRSSEHAITSVGRYSPSQRSTDLDSDYLIEPQSCKSIVWTMPLERFDFYEVGYSRGYWVGDYVF